MLTAHSDPTNRELTLPERPAPLSSKPKRRAPSPQEKAAILAQNDRADRARRSYPKLDKDGTYRVACNELAREAGADANALWEEFARRAETRSYLGESTITDAERLAFDDVAQRFKRAA